MVSDVFISHSLLDTITAGAVSEFLEARNIRCWLSPRDIPPGDDPHDSALRAIQASPILVLLFSRNANDSEPVQKEVSHAVKAGKLVIPFRIENVAPTGEMEQYFRQRFWHDAHLPPLEQHLEELVRILRPLVHKRIPKMAEDASISRTLPSRSSIVRGADAGGSPKKSKAHGPLRVAFNFNHVLVAGQASALEFKIENEGSEPLEKIGIALESRALKREAVRTFPELAPGQVQTGVLEIEPVRSEQLILQIAVKFRAGSTQFSFSGYRTLRVNEAPAASNPLGDLKRSSATALLPLRENLKPPVAPANPELAVTFETLDLSLDYEVGVEALDVAHTPRPLQIPPALLNLARAGTLLRLEPKDTAPGGSPHQELRLVARPSFSLGRSLEESDFLLWFWPRNEIHDTKTRRISKKHCTLTVKNGKFYVGNTAAASLTTFDNQDVTGPEGVSLGRRGILNLSGIYFLELTRFPSSYTQGPEISNLPQWKGTELAAGANPSPGGSVRFTPRTPHVLPQNSTWLLSDGTFGSSQANPVVLEDVAEIQGRFHHHLGCFWIENLAPNAAVEIDGDALNSGSIAPLVGGQTVQLGQKRYLVIVEA